jgi:Holliday junction DNA helicase RuvA
MIGSLRGTLLDWAARSAHAAELVVEVGGVGYRVLVPAGSSARVGPMGTGVFLHIHTHVRDDAIVLYGFTQRDERACFEALIGAHGVGPSVALALLSVHSPLALRRAVESDDADALMLVPGIGRKTATRLLVELKSRLDVDDGDDGGLSVVATSGGSPNGGSSRSDVRTALANLGYGADEIRQALIHLPAEGTVEDHLRLALRQLASSR